MHNLPIGYRVPLLIFLTIVTIFTIIGNGLVILAWKFHPVVRKPGNVYLVSLACADIVVGLLLAPTMMGELASNAWPYGRVWCQIYMLLAWLLSAVSILHLIAIAMDRYHTIFDSFTYIRRRTYPFVFRRIFLVWSFSIWLIIPPMLDWEAIGERSETFGVCFSNMSKGLSVHFAFGCYFLPMILLTSTYFAIYRKLEQRRSRATSENSCATIVHLPTIYVGPVSQNGRRDTVDTTNSGMDKKMDLLDKNHRAAKMLALILLVFGVSWLPFTLGYTIIGFLPEDGRPSPVALPIMVAIGYSNSAMNPIIYAYCNPDFRQGFKKILFFWRK